ncbi:MAG TPA: endonuclease domain-containing protein [Dehalococcoidia bacterium]
MATEPTTRREMPKVGTTSPPAAATPSPQAERGGSNAGWSTPPALWRGLKPLAREKRLSPTPSEDRLWQALRSGPFRTSGFRRQHPIGRFIVDLYCSQAQLVIEIDGPIHRRTAAEDAARQAELEARGLAVVRFSNAEIMGEFQRVLAEVSRTLAERTSPSLPAERGNEGERSHGD